MSCLLRCTHESPMHMLSSNFGYYTHQARSICTLQSSTFDHNYKHAENNVHAQVPATDVYSLWPQGLRVAPAVPTLEC